MSELRKDPILGRWVIIASERGKRPGAFQTIPEEKNEAICPFCYGNEHMTPPEIYAIRHDKSPPNTQGWKTRVVPNKFPALGIDEKLAKRGVGMMYDMMVGYGAHEVIIDTPDHHRNIKDQSIHDITNVISCIQHRIEDLHKDVQMRYVLVFKNKGKEAGASLFHPHTQLIATPVTPITVKAELQGAESYFKMKERCIFCDIMHEELSLEKRIVYENDGFVAFCPYASRFPFEVWILPKNHDIDFHSESVVKNNHFLAEILKIVFQKLAIGLNDPQYNYVIHTAPNRFARRGYWQTLHEDFHWHIEIMPKLTRVAGFEWGTGFYINPTPPEDAAKHLREVEID
ncbi:TPA: galactose-1-phosphate uridylyltransferase [bacterium]|nr:galactose-1-phosphate uridylyltransferase [bacterium]